MKREKMLVKLNTGATIPVLGFGTASDPVSEEEKKAAISAALEVGYRHFDTGSFYGSERALGESLKDAFDAGIVTRDEVFVTTKLWCTDVYPDGVIPAIRKSLRTLRLEYVDLYLIHWPLRIKEGSRFHNLKEGDFLPLDIKGTWQRMETCMDLGFTKAIGVSNFSSKKIEDLLSYARIPPAVNQVEMHPMFQQKSLREFSSKVNIHVSAWSPLGAFGSSWGSRGVLEHPVIKEIASSHGRTPAQVALRWGVEEGVSVLPKSFNRARMVENMKIFEWHLSQDDHEQINRMEQSRIQPAHQACNTTTSPYKTIQELWDDEED
eukprot:c6528_g1_i1 orf=1-960(-)